MLYYELTDQHSAKRERPPEIARLYVHKVEWSDLQTICASHGPYEIVGIEPVPMIPTLHVEILCQDSSAAFELAVAWYEYCGTSPHRPHSKKATLAWGQQFNAYPDIPHDWTF